MEYTFLHKRFHVFTILWVISFLLGLISFMVLLDGDVIKITAIVVSSVFMGLAPVVYPFYLMTKFKVYSLDNRYNNNISLSVFKLVGSTVLLGFTIYLMSSSIAIGDTVLTFDLFEGLTFIFLFVGCIAIGFGDLIVKLVIKRIEYLLEHGRRTSAEIKSVKPMMYEGYNYGTKSSSSTKIMLEDTYSEEQYSCVVTYDATKPINAMGITSLDVFIDPNNPKKYYVDTRML